ncbi:MAG: hypothetical protein HQK53_17845 [Oligoflexia bacterium]|nr:hypothetical protein [Oligoflexia bacterium]
MNELQNLSKKIADLKISGRKTIPLSLKEEVVRAIESSDINLDAAAEILNLHPMTFYKWRRYLKRKGNSKKATKSASSGKDYKKYSDSFIEINPSTPPSKTTSVTPTTCSSQLFLEISLDNGVHYNALLRIYR